MPQVCHVDASLKTLSLPPHLVAIEQSEAARQLSSIFSAAFAEFATEVGELLGGLATAARDADAGDGKFARQTDAGGLCVLLEAAGGGGEGGGGGGAHAAAPGGGASATRRSYAAADNAAPLEACVSKLRHDLCARLAAVLFRYPLFVHVQRVPALHTGYSRGSQYASRRSSSSSAHSQQGAEVQGLILDLGGLIGCSESGDLVQALARTHMLGRLVASRLQVYW
jgi:hypothetical protein